MPPIPYLPGVLPAPTGVGSLASPGTQRPSTIPGPDSQTLMASPLSDRLGGLVMGQQQQAELQKIADLVQQGLRLLGMKTAMTDPKKAGQLEGFAAKMRTMFAHTPTPGPHAPTQMAGALPTPPSPMQGFPPPPAPGTGGGMPFQPPMMGR